MFIDVYLNLLSLCSYTFQGKYRNEKFPFYNE